MDANRFGRSRSHHRAGAGPAARAGLIRTARLCLMLALPVSLAGCSIFPWMAHVVGGGSGNVTVKAEYTGLADQQVAVLVAADNRTLYRAPRAPERVCRAVSSYIAEHVPTATLMDPHRALTFQREHPYWATMPPAELLEQLRVDRLMVIDVAEYRLHEPGNRHLVRGVLTANLAVHEAGASDPNNPDYYRTLTARFPEESTFGEVNADEQAIEAGMIQSFGLRVARLFHDHEIRQ